MSSPLDSVVILLYQPQDIVNVAGVIRVMSNFGLSDLRLVEPAAFDPYRLLGIAHHTDQLVAAARRFPTLAEAARDCAYLLGTTGRPREVLRPVFSPRQAAPRLLQTVSKNPGRKVALLFGREQDGLPNEALDLCHGIVTIPTDVANRSLNLAQAALVLAYELWVTAAEWAQEGETGSTGSALATAVRPGAMADLAGGELREEIFSALEGLLHALYPGSSPTRMTGALSRLRGLLLRAAPQEEEAQAFVNLFRHAARIISSKPYRP